jgi:ribose 5-phosphate isomerase
LRDVPGVVETGLFVGRADLVIVAEEGGVRRLTRR